MVHIQFHTLHFQTLTNLMISKAGKGVVLSELLLVVVFLILEIGQRVCVLEATQPA